MTPSTTRDSGPAEPPPIAVRSVTSGYPGIIALQEVSLTVEQQRICALVGANGSGKSTLFNTLLGLRPPLTGSVRLFGHSPTVARRSNLVSYVPQHEQIDTTFPVTVEQVVMMGRYGRMGLLRRPRAADRRAVDQALEQVDLSALRSRAIGELSGGQRRRAFLARSIAQQAPLMLLDEPFAGVDRISERLVTEVLFQLRDAGTTLLVSTHHVEGVGALADEVVLLHQRVLAAGLPQDVLTEEQLGQAFGAVLTARAPNRTGSIRWDDQAKEDR